MTDTVKITLRNLPKPLHAALKKLALANRHSMNDEVVIAIEGHVARPNAIGRVTITEEQIDAINEAESLVSRLAGSYDIYGGIDLKACLKTLGKITGTYDGTEDIKRVKRAKGRK